MRRIYFHGLPGGPAELGLVEGPLPECSLRQLPPAEMAAQIRAEHPAEELHLIGFSLGAAYALQLAAHVAPARLDLIAPAGPLGLGDFLPRMAGRPVFASARFPSALALLSFAQACVLATAPGAFLQALFSTAPEADRSLLADEQCRAHLLDAFRQSLNRGRKAYVREVVAYVGRWDVPKLKCPVTIWQGTSDTWVPPDMAQALAARLPGAVVKFLPGLGHYSALKAALPQIMAGLDLGARTADNRDDAS